MNMFLQTVRVLVHGLTSLIIFWGGECLNIISRLILSALFLLEHDVWIMFTQVQWRIFKHRIGVYLKRAKCAMHLRGFYT